MQCRPIPIHKWKKIRKGNYDIIIAKTACQKMQGLQGVSSLSNNTLLLFLGMSPGKFFHTFNCLFPIDIISLDINGRVLAIWTSNQEKQSIGPTPRKTARVLEAPAGWCRSKKINVGDYLPFLKC